MLFGVAMEDGLFFCATLRAEEGDAPAEMNEAEPEFFSSGWMGAEPRFEILVGGLPVFPLNSGGINGTGFGAEIVDIEGR